MLAASNAVFTVLAFDWGQQRTGLAYGTSLTGTGRTLPTLQASNEKTRIAAAMTQIQQWQPDALVVGLPTHADGRAHLNTARALRFARQLQGHTRLPVHLVDERYSSLAAQAEGMRDVDAGAALILLEQFFRAPQSAAGL